MKKQALAILHFNPIELYPPVINLLNYIAEHAPSLRVYVFTNRANDPIRAYASKQKNIIIKRYGAYGQNFSLLKRYQRYFAYYYQTYTSLRKIHPEWLWYFETISALPARWYFSGPRSRDTKLLIHYHEYMSPSEYAKGPLMIKWMHRGEKKLYKIVHWLSHTNEKRMQLFLEDEQINLSGRTHILPNYPPKSWILEKDEQRTTAYPLKIVYVGAIGMESLYIKEFCGWVHEQNGAVVFDIYSNQDTTELHAFLAGLGLRFIDIKGHVPYEALPDVLRLYDVGVILYKGHIPNYVYNAPNKLFEYRACGLDVWFPAAMEGCQPYVTDAIYPKVVSVNFEALDKLDLPSTIGHFGLTYQPSEYYAEKVLGEALCEGFGLA